MTRDGPLAELRSLAADPGSGLVFFVGAGVSASATGIPATPDLLGTLVVAAARRAGLPDPDAISALVGRSLGFEVVLNDLWQICPTAVRAFFGSMVALEAAATPGAAHRFMAGWLARGGTVVTTNYDRLIERSSGQGRPGIVVRYRERPAEGSNAASHTGFRLWERDLARGHVLFKIHGSLAQPDSCLGALEHVGTVLTGDRADMVRDVMRKRPVCFVGWRGADPDIPPLIRDAVAERDPDMPLLWVYRSESSRAKVSPLLRALPGARHLICTADELFSKLDPTLAAGRQSDRHEGPSVHVGGPKRRAERPMAAECTPSGMARFLGIELRRSDRPVEALAVFDAAARMAEGEWQAADEERALTLWAANRGQDQRVARRIVAKARRFGASPSPVRPAVPTATFGLLSMTIVLSRARPWLLLKVPRLMRTYRREIDELRDQGGDPADVALHQALLGLYQGRLRLQLLGGRSWGSRRLAGWVLGPLLRARRTIDLAGGRSLHARFDVIAGLATAAARFGDCLRARAQLEELDRLAQLLSDPARLRVWDRQRAEIARRCPARSEPRMD